MTNDIAEALKHVYDPELGIDIVSLGLVYGIEEDERGVRVRITVTSPGCPMGAAIQDAVWKAIAQIRPEGNIVVDITGDPPWNLKMLTPEARARLGIA